MHLSSKSNRDAAIDLLRGLSILLVVVHHMALRIPLKGAYLSGRAAIATGVIAALIAHCFGGPCMRIRRGLCALGILGMASSVLFGALLSPLIGNGLMPVLTLSTGILLIALQHDRAPAPLGARWRASMGSLSYEIYLTNMFIVFAAVALYRANAAHPWLGFLWYAPILLACWLLGALRARAWSIPWHRALRVRWLEPAKTTLTAP